MIYNVKLRYFEDDATGSWGFAHEETFDRGFNAFYSPDGIFHDVFEHYFEGQKKYFKGNNQCNILGEMVATAHKLYYYEMGINAFRYRDNNISPSSWREDTEPLLHEYFGDEDSWSDYNLHDVGIPHQKDPKSYNLDSAIYDYHSYIKEEFPQYSKKLKLSWITNAYRRGYNMAEKKWGNQQNAAYQMMDKFLDEWHTFTRYAAADTLLIEGTDYALRAINFRVDTVKCKVKATVEDQLRQVFPFKALISY